MSPSNVQALPTDTCHACGQLTPWRCMQCQRPTCATCQFSMHAMCQDCRAAYRGPIWQLGKRADAYIANEFRRLFGMPEVAPVMQPARELVAA